MLSIKFNISVNHTTFHTRMYRQLGPPLKSQGLLKKTGHMHSQMFIGLQCCKDHSEHLI